MQFCALASVPWHPRQREFDKPHYHDIAGREKENLYTSYLKTRSRFLSVVIGQDLQSTYSSFFLFILRPS